MRSKYFSFFPNTNLATDNTISIVVYQENHKYMGELIVHDGIMSKMRIFDPLYDSISYSLPYI